MSDNRRDFLKKGALLGLSGFAGSLIGKEKIEGLENLSSLIEDGAGRFVQLPLPYAYNALEPFIDAKTMEIHYSKHHKGYVDKLNDANPAGINYGVSDAEKCKSINAATPALVRNNLGGHYNHTLFWQLLKPNPGNTANVPGGKLGAAINKTFNTFDEFKKEFSDKAMKIFGSGWCWLIVDEKMMLHIVTTPNQDNPLMNFSAHSTTTATVRVPGMVEAEKKSEDVESSPNGKPVLALDVWEHAYYLKHQNKRADYIADWWHVVNWKKADELFS